MFLHKNNKLSENNANSFEKPVFFTFFHRKGKKACSLAHGFLVSTFEPSFRKEMKERINKNG